MIRVCEVLSVDDSENGERIKVKYSKSLNSLSEIDYVQPFLPKMLHIKPKVGEGGLVFSSDENDENSTKYYIGPVISQLNHMEKEPFYLDATALYKGSRITADKAPDLNPKTVGAYMNNDDIGLYGRKNTELRLRDNDARLESGVRLANPSNPRDIIFNTKSPAYLKLAHYDNNQQSGNDEYQSTATIVADKINLISNCNTENFITANGEELISEEDMKKIIEKAHKLPYGDVLIDFLKLFRTAFLNHTHPFATMTPCVDSTVFKVAGYDLDRMLSNDIRIS